MSLHDTKRRIQATVKKTNHYSAGIAVVLLMTVYISCKSQEKINVSAGAGIPELINASVKFQFNQSQIGFSLGSMPASDESLLSLTGMAFYHFAGNSSYSERKPWFFRGGFDFLRDETRSITDKYLYLDLRLGRDLNLSDRWGVGLDAGPLIQLFHDRTSKNETTGWFNLDIDFPVLPCAGICLYYRFL